MQRKLFLIALLCIQYSNECDSQVISINNSPAGDMVFVGKPSDMPLDNSKLFAVQPTIFNNKLYIPNDFNNSMNEINKMLPTWYLNALKHSKGEYECIVDINNVDYDGVFSDWIADSWRLEEEKSPVNLMFNKYNLGSATSERVDALHFSFCTYLKHGMKEALIVFKSYGGRKKE